MSTEMLKQGNPAASKALHETLDKLAAAFTVLHMKLHHHHWYVKGPHFFTLHEKFEELYNEAAAHIDALAERLLAIGGKPTATLKGALALSVIKEAEGAGTAEKMAEETANDFAILIGELKEGIELAEAAGDEGTADLLLSIQSGLEKHVWMLRAFAG
jgi:DNA-binding ferritin-like protein (oxidative damage protectant)